MMKHLFRQLPFVVAFCALGLGLWSCESEDFTLGESLVSGEPFTLTKQTYAIESVKQLSLDRVQTNKMPLYQLGNYKDPLFGETRASLVSQVQLSLPNPVFGELSASAEIDNDLDERETVTKVTLYIPYQRASAVTADRDGDGVLDVFDVDPDDPQSDSDGDGLTDNDERLLGTDPLSADTDKDGIPDADDPETTANSFARRFDLDSIFSFSGQDRFKLTVRPSDYYLRDNDPQTDFLESQAYFSDKQSVFEPFLGKSLFEGPVVISDFQYVTYNEDDPTTPDVDESLTIDVSQSRDPGILVELDKSFFQDRIFDLEGSEALRSQSNFKDHLRGLHLSIDASDDLMLLLDLSTAFILMEYEYDSINTQGTTDTADDTRDQSSATFRLNFITGSAQGFTQGNAVNTWEYDRLMPATSDESVLPNRMYLKGGNGSVVQFELPQRVIDEVKQNNWLINEASLEFYVDQEAMAPIPFEPSRLYMYKSTNSFPIYNARNETSSSQTALGVYQNYDASLRRSANGRGESYKVNITDYFNDMVVRDSLNVPINISVSANIAFPQVQQAVLEDGSAIDYPLMSGITPFGTVLYGPSSEVIEEKRLKLNLFYTALNEN
jgi:hypothetical protein